MTKRTLLIIIALLVVVDIVAAFWYLALRIENSGQSGDIFVRGETETAAQADTVIDSSLPDVFALGSDEAFFVSQEAAGTERGQLLSVKRVTNRWPQSINGSDSLVNIERELVRKAFSRSYGTLAEAVGSFLSEPQFNYGSGLAFTRVPQAANVPARNRNVRHVLVYPYSTSFQLLVMEIDHYGYSGDGWSKRTAYVVYDRVRQRVIDRDNMLIPGQETALLAVLNKKIAHINQTQHLDLLSASQVPAEVCPKRTGMVFEFQEGDIAPSSKGVIDVFIDYAALKPYLTDAFRTIVNHNGGYWEYKALRPGDVAPAE